MPARYWQLARVRLRQGDVDESLKQLRRASKVKADLLPPEATIAGWFQELGDSKNSVKWLGQAVQANPNDLKTRLMASRVLLRLRKFDEAAVHADAALKLSNSSFESRLMRGNIAILSGDTASAIQHLEAAVLKSPKSFVAANNLAIALCESGKETDRKRGLEYSQVNYQRFSDQPEAIATLGRAFYKTGSLKEAEQALARAVQAGSSNPDAAYYLARVLVDQGRNDDARTILQQTIQTTAPFLKYAQARSLLGDLDKLAGAQQ